MTTHSHLTDKELIDQLTLRDDLTELEHELLDRLIVVTDVLSGYPQESPPENRELGFGVHD